MTEKEVAMVYNTILNTPYMKENVKINGKVSRKAVLLLHTIVELGTVLKKDSKTSGLLSHLPDEVFDELKVVTGEALQEAQLQETSENLKNFLTEK